MRILALVLTAITLPSALALNSAPAQATLNQKSWVSGAGSDASPCTFASPCATLQRAHDQTLAGGEIGVIGAGDYGQIIISKSISVVAEGGEASILAPSGDDAVRVQAGSNDVVLLRGLIIDGGGTGVVGMRLQVFATVHIEKCLIRNFGGIGIEIEPQNPAEAFVSDTTIVNNGSASNVGGILIAPVAAIPVKVVLNRVEANENYRGIKADGQFGTGSIMNINVRDSVASGNTNNGIVATTPSGGGTILMTLDRVTSSNNGGTTPASVGVVSDGPNSFIRLTNSTVTGNWNGLSFTNGATLSSFGNNTIAGNAVDGSPSVTVGLR